MPRVFLFDRNNPDAVSAIKKITSQRIKPGMFIPLTEDEYAAMQDAVMSLDFDDPPTPKGEAENDSGNNGDQA